MTGEISLKGKALAIGGLKEKSMAAYKAGCDTVLIPEENKKDLSEISKEVSEAVTFICVNDFEELMPYALEYIPTPETSKAYITKPNDIKSVTQSAAQ